MGLRKLAKRVLGVQRQPTYYLPWLTRPHLQCALVLSNVESRFKVGYNRGSFPVSVVQYDGDGAVAGRHEVTLPDAVEAVELPLPPAPGGCGFVTVRGERINSDLYVTLSDGLAYTATHGRGEFIERYALRGRLLLAMIGGLLGLAGRAVPAFVRHQYAYVGPDSCSHLLVMNLSDVTNRVRVVASRDGRVLGARLLRLPPMGSTLLDIATLGAESGRSDSDSGPAAPRGAATEVWRLRLEGAAWFNLYVVGAGARNLEGPLSLMHVK
jgi:hypothetical protein